jgi:diguanylate cyclase (GGDEF)-like protein/PAS domain S-box-containing protein
VFKSFKLLSFSNYWDKRSQQLSLGRSNCETRFFYPLKPKFLLTFFDKIGSSSAMPSPTQIPTIHTDKTDGARAHTLSSIMEAITDPVFVKDTEHRWVFVNQAFCEFLGREREWLIGKSDFDWSSPAEAQVFWDKDNEVFETGNTIINLERHTSLDGQVRVIESKKSRIELDGKFYVVGVIRDLTVLTQIQAELAQMNGDLERRVREQTEELHRANSKLHNLAYFDPLTGLPNRRMLQSTLERKVTEHAIAFFYMDLDHFKRANDSHGHSFGDALITQIALRLLNSPLFSFVARVGGDEFVAINRDGLSLDRMTLGHACREILELVSKPMMVDGIETSASMSIGVAVSPHDGNNFSSLMQSADSAMYKAKSRRNQYAFFSHQMRDQAKENAALERGLRRAIRGGDIDVSFQPIFDARTNLQIGVEALARWNDIELGAVSPELFIPIAESSGLMHELSQFVLRKAARLARAHLPADQMLSVNMSAMQLDRITLLEDIQRALESADFPANRLELEITESVTASKDLRYLQILQSIRDMGIRLALDDFGTGYSALSHIQKLPIDRIKIDKSFTMDVVTNPKSRALVAAMIQMAHGLELQVVAEGIETDVHRQILTRLGCDALQGYLLGRPQKFS